MKNLEVTAQIPSLKFNILEDKINFQTLKLGFKIESN